MKYQNQYHRLTNNQNETALKNQLVKRANRSIFYIFNSPTIDKNGLRELAYTTSYVETNNSSEGQLTLSSNQE
jgi:hypothetical protein